MIVLSILEQYIYARSESKYLYAPFFRNEAFSTILEHLKLKFISHILSLTGQILKELFPSVSVPRVKNIHLATSRLGRIYQPVNQRSKRLQSLYFYAVF